MAIAVDGGAFFTNRQDAKGAKVRRENVCYSLCFGVSKRTNTAPMSNPNPCVQ